MPVWGGSKCLKLLALVAPLKEVWNTKITDHPKKSEKRCHRRRETVQDVRAEVPGRQLCDLGLRSHLLLKRSMARGSRCTEHKC